MMDCATMDDIITRIDAKIHGGMNDDEAEIEFELREVMDLRGAFEGVRHELFHVRKCGIPAFVAKDLVRDKFNGKSFYVTDAEVTEGDNGFEWHYRSGFYFIPQSDLELVKPRGVN
jgi:hypothetical protein